MTVPNKAAAYANNDVYSGAMYADPHSLITQMLDGALTRIAQAKGAIARSDVAAKAELISKAVLIVGGLEGCVSHERGGDLAVNLSRLYQYMSVTLTQANISNDIEKLEEVSRLLLEIKSAWVQVPAQINKAST
ncbi:MAG: flagellar protein FliS [Planctomycetota bacterium]|jgi:flagellar protein FliS